MAVFFGTLEKLQLLKCALTELPVTSRGYMENLSFVNGGSDVVASFGASRVFDLSWRGNPSEMNPFVDYKRGIHGDGLIYMVDPMAERYNLLMPNWASPRLIEVGDWKNLYDTEPVFSDTAANGYDQPPRTATWDITSAADALPTKSRMVHTLIIPPGKTLHLGASGSKTGDAVLRVQPINVDGTNAAPVDLTMLDAAAPTRFNASFSGGTYKAVRIYMTRTAATASTLSLTSMMAQLWNTSLTPVGGKHVPGQGFGGLAFSSDIHESYVIAAGPGRERKGVSVQMTEVESWR